MVRIVLGSQGGWGMGGVDHEGFQGHDGCVDGSLAVWMY